VVKEEEEHRNGRGQRDVAEPFGSERGPAGNAEQLGRGQRGLDPLGQPQHIADRLKSYGA
jgi:hypothetical protein